MGRITGGATEHERKVFDRMLERHMEQGKVFGVRPGREAEDKARRVVENVAKETMQRIEDKRRGRVR